MSGSVLIICWWYWAVGPWNAMYHCRFSWQSPPWTRRQSCSEYWPEVAAPFQWISLREILQETPYLMVKTMVSCRFSLKPNHWPLEMTQANISNAAMVRRIPKLHGSSVLESSCQWWQIWYNMIVTGMVTAMLFCIWGFPKMGDPHFMVGL